MKDTSIEVRTALRNRYRALSPEARVRMACGMFTSARRLGRAGAEARGTPWDREAILRSLYSADLSPSVLAALAERLRGLCSCDRLRDRTGPGR